MQPQPNTEHADVLSAMLRIAEGEIRSKDEQVALLHQMVAANEQEVRRKDVRIAELEKALQAQQTEVEQFKQLFTRYLERAEEARSKSAFSRTTDAATKAHSGLAGASGCAAASLLTSAARTAMAATGGGLPPPTAAALGGDSLLNATASLSLPSASISSSLDETRAARDLQLLDEPSPRTQVDDATIDMPIDPDSTIE